MAEVASGSDLHVGASQVDITPPVGVELSGFAARIQPSIGVLDPLYARALYLVRNQRRLLWVHLDLIGVRRDLVAAFREWARRHLGLAAEEVLISATHTHSGPATIELAESGRYDAGYAEFLQRKMVLAASRAATRTSACAMVSVQTRLSLAVDRRGKASAHTDPRVKAVAFRRADGTFIAAIVNYAMHAVALGASNRLISGDVPGEIAAQLSRELPGGPVVLATNGACGNLNPPGENVAPATMRAWGRAIADSVAPLIRAAVPQPAANLSAATRVLPLPLRALTEAQIAEHARKALALPEPLAQWGDRYRRAVAAWQETMSAAARNGEQPVAQVEAFALCLGPDRWVGVSAEVFSEFADLVAGFAGCPVHVVGYANGNTGYIPSRSAFDEGGYEVEVAHLFYRSLPPLREGIELLAREAADLLARLETTGTGAAECDVTGESGSPHRLARAAAGRSMLIR